MTTALIEIANSTHPTTSSATDARRDMKADSP
jgi:hypothetical protein